MIKITFYKEEQSNLIKVQGTLEADFLQNMKQTRIIKYMSDLAWLTPNEISLLSGTYDFFCMIIKFHQMKLNRNK